MVEQSKSREEMKPQRFKSLDGLRGVAALVVVIHHCLLVVPALASGDPGEHSLVVDLLKFTPLHVAWIGTEAVWLFFILSGFVLTLPFVSGRGFDAVAYYPRRLIRIYLPAWAALAIAAVLTLVVVRPDASAGAWMDRHNNQPFGETLIDAALVFGGSTLNTPLWSLQWEVLYSLLLPFALVAFGRPTRWWPALASALLAVIVLGALLDLRAVFLLPMFFLGSVLAANWARIDAVVQRLLSWGLTDLLGWSLLVVALLFLTLKWTLLPLGLPSILSSAAQGTSIAGILIVFVLSVVWAPARAFLSRRTLQWLGRISFSLYLVHEPIVVTVGSALGPNRSPLTIFLALPLSLLAGWLFHQIIERPSHRLARRVGTLVANRHTRGDRAGASREVR
ncbi:acyltransferase [Rathayibacter sp. VKM Ac-2928]|uniref:acyltransferase family protein n=1 Tax=Rathayibacter sp. VKM Ac-2928 TaxID=2929479 RepID=UPI001FB3A907|nr:acyltransferase [Rathayibacter sp. VKM Ac-2928]MCJ1682392.1 acyltransferase [Rathayibacter sp. VKM Ac-2928]